ncbi:Glycoside hydrolase, superfamily [Penicillium expansum]|nr:Glycoside hydrolase, superfamily [Penicillium expansum]KGO47316.1 Glycoside hydrolase, superfamily [Penicillium expansum]
MMFKSFAAVSALSLFASSAAAVDPSLKNNVALYYGQGYNQQRLKHFCEQSTSDIINIGFINKFPQYQGDYPGSNFANQCDGAFFPGTELLSGCHQIWQDIPSCKAAGKTVLLSIGGGSATTQSLPDDATGEWFADFLWYSFGPYNSAISSLGWEESMLGQLYPRPFLTAAVDGFDFDIEYNGGVGYAAMINRLREHFSTDTTQTYYISGAPQCPIPDAQLSDAIARSSFDFLWVQFYNTEGCSAANWVNGTGNFNFDDWVGVIENSANTDTKLFIGTAPC